MNNLSKQEFILLCNIYLNNRKEIFHSYTQLARCSGVASSSPIFQKVLKKLKENEIMFNLENIGRNVTFEMNKEKLFKFIKNSELYLLIENVMHKKSSFTKTPK